MKAIYDRNIVDPENQGLPWLNRGFLYGDGLFETIIYSGRQIRYLQDHFDRITAGCRMLSLVLPEHFTVDNLESEILKLVRENGLSGPVRIKLLVWRVSGGLYEPLQQEAHYMILTDEIRENIPRQKRRVGFSTRIFNYPAPWSAFKTQSSLPYVLAGIEKKEKDLEDIIILDSDGNISELLYANIFWISKGLFYTPSLDTGCIRGVMRTCLIRKLDGKGISVNEVAAGRDILLNADFVFSANVTGLIPVTGIEDREFEEYPDLQDLEP
jgi:4-amino-4-deoxychorismate lyase